MKKIFPLVFALVMGSLLLSGCNSGDPKPWLPATWTNVSYGMTTIIKITATTISYSDSYNDYEGIISNTPDFEASDGVLIIKFTKCADGDSGSLNKYGALYWKELTPTSVYMADAYVHEGQNWLRAVFDDLPTAKASFTRDNEGTYISDWSIVSPYHN